MHRLSLASLPFTNFIDPYIFNLILAMINLEALISTVENRYAINHQVFVE